MRKLTHTAKVIGKNNDLSRRIELPEIAKDEVYELTTTFNRMLSGLEDSSNRESNSVLTYLMNCVHRLPLSKLKVSTPSNMREHQRRCKKA